MSWFFVLSILCVLLFPVVSGSLRFSPRMNLIGFLALAFCWPGPLTAEFKTLSEREPAVDAILWAPSGGRAWIRVQDLKYHVAKGMTVDEEWRVEDVRRASVLFKRKSTGTFVEIPLVTKERPRFQRDWSFWGNPISLWEALECLVRGFQMDAVMHCLCSGTVTPHFHATIAEKLLVQITPRHHRFFLAGQTVLMLPVIVDGEKWGKILGRMKQFRSDFLMLRFPGMARLGSLLARGDDIQQVLRRISLGSGTLIRFPADLHFPVYATFSHQPFHTILGKILLLNQCAVVERASFLEVMPLRAGVGLQNLTEPPPTTVTGPIDLPDGIGDNPPPIEPAPIPVQAVPELILDPSIPPPAPPPVSRYGR